MGGCVVGVVLRKRSKLHSFQIVYSMDMGNINSTNCLLCYEGSVLK